MKHLFIAHPQWREACWRCHQESGRYTFRAVHPYFMLPPVLTWVARKEVMKEVQEKGRWIVSGVYDQQGYFTAVDGSVN